MGFKVEGIYRIITYYNEDKKDSYCCFIYDDESIVDVPVSVGAIYLQQYLNSRGYRKDNLDTVYKDRIFFLHLNQREKKQYEEEALEFIREKKPIKKMPVLGAPLFKSKKKHSFKKIKDQFTKIKDAVSRNKVGSKVKNLVVNHKKLTAFAAVATVLIYGVSHTNSNQNNNYSASTTVQTTVQPTITPTVTPTPTPTPTVLPTADKNEDLNQSLWDQVYRKASFIQQKFMDSISSFSTNLIDFNTIHREENVVFPDGHQEPIVEFGYTKEELASAYILGANFDTESYSAFMNASDISIEEYKGYYQSWYKKMHYEYLIRNSQFETGILDLVPSTSAGYDFIKQIDDLHKELVTAQKNNDIEAQKAIVNQFYQIKNETFKLQEASQKEATYENFKNLDIPDYALLTLPIFDAIGEEYRNVLMNDGKQFYNELDEQVFSHNGIYCHIYEYTMLENVAAHTAKLSQLTYKADESYADYDTVMAAIASKATELNLITDDSNENRYDVQNLQAVKEVLAKDFTLSIQMENSQTSSNTSSTSTSNKGSLVSDTITRTTKEEKVEKEEVKVKEEDLTEQEKQEATVQKAEIQEDLKQQSDKNKEEAIQKAEDEALKDQAKEDEKREELEQEVQKENEQVEQEIEDMKPGEAIPDDKITVNPEYQDDESNGINDQFVTDPTVDGTGAYEDFPDLNGDGSNLPEETLPPLPVEDSTQSDTIIEEEEPPVSADSSEVIEVGPDDEVPVDETVVVVTSTSRQPTYQEQESYEISLSEKEEIVAALNDWIATQQVEAMSQVSQTEEAPLVYYK